MKKIIKKILKLLGWGSLVFLVVAQFFRIDKTNPERDLSLDFLAVEAPPVHVVKLIRNACYDCHSYETVYPWYTNVAPVSWRVRHHIDEGRYYLNFSTWKNEKEERKAELYEEMVEEVEDGAMPLWDYKLMHSQARLSDPERTQLLEWLKTKQEGSGD